MKLASKKSAATKTVRPKSAQKQAAATSDPNPEQMEQWLRSALDGVDTERQQGTLELVPLTLEDRERCALVKSVVKAHYRSLVYVEELAKLRKLSVHEPDLTRERVQECQAEIAEALRDLLSLYAPNGGSPVAAAPEWLLPS